MILFAALAGTVVLAALSPGNDEALTGSPSPTSTKTGGRSESGSTLPGMAAESGSGQLALPDRPPLGKPRAELFGSRSLQLPTSSIVAAPPAPTAPPMPYRYAGKLVQGGQSSVLLSKGDAVFPIKEGQTLDGPYRVESIGDAQITLMYLPLKHRENIPVFSLLPGATPGQPGSAAAMSAGQAAPAAAVTARDAAPAAGAPAGNAPVSSASGAQNLDSGPAQLLWEGPQRVKLGSRFEVALKVTSGQPLQAVPMQLKFDPAYLEFVAAKPGKYFGGVTPNFSYRANADGSIFVGATSKNPVPVSDAELLVLTFLPVKPALAAEVSIASVSLHGLAGRPIAFGQPVAFKTAITP